MTDTWSPWDHLCCNNCFNERGVELVRIVFMEVVEAYCPACKKNSFTRRPMHPAYWGEEVGG